jgi:transposase InsO family protein
MKHPDPDHVIALWRFAILGPLVSARLEHGDRQAHFREVAQKRHVHPTTGKEVRFQQRTIEGWYQDYRAHGLAGLTPRRRADRGKTRVIRPELAELLLRAKRERPRRSIRRLIRILERAGKAAPGELTRSSIHRLLVQHGASRRPPRGPTAERRSFLVEQAGDLWLGDAKHGPVVLADGRPRKVYLLSQLDCATRYVPHSYWATSEGAVAHEYGFKQAILKSGRPRAYYVDHGSAYVAGSLRSICAELGIELLHARVRDAEAKGAIERWHRTVGEEFLDELVLPEDPTLTIEELNSRYWAWLAEEYHSRIHSTTQKSPRQHWLTEAQLGHVRPVRRGCDLDQVFLHRARRKVRKDGTVSLEGRWLEVRPELVGKMVELRYDPSDPLGLPRVFLDGAFVCDTVPLDRVRNATRRRRRDLGEPEPHSEPSGLDPLGQIADDHYRRTRLLHEQAKIQEQD